MHCYRKEVASYQVHKTHLLSLVHLMTLMENKLWEAYYQVHKIIMLGYCSL